MVEEEFILSLFYQYLVICSGVGVSTVAKDNFETLTNLIRNL